jgi:predicted TIM-barrel fold metal-dependent hydrolase
MPAGTCDCHFHVFGPAAQYSLAAGRAYTPPDASVAAYRKLASTLGIERAVIVQPSVYGLDNSRTLSAMQELGLPVRAVVVIDDTISDEELLDLHAKGVRGVRVNLIFGGIAQATAERMAERIRDLGWHLQILANVATIPALRRWVAGLGLPVVFDHFGHAPTSAGVESPGFQALIDLVTDGLAWVKISAPYRISGLPNVPYQDVDPFAMALIKANPSRLLWGTDWPHPSIKQAVPNDGDLADLLLQWMPDISLAKLVLVDNPAALYGFGAI